MSGGWRWWWSAEWDCVVAARKIAEGGARKPLVLQLLLDDKRLEKAGICVALRCATCAGWPRWGDDSDDEAVGVGQGATFAFEDEVQADPLSPLSTSRFLLHALLALTTSLAPFRSMLMRTENFDARTNSTRTTKQQRLLHRKQSKEHPPTTLSPMDASSNRWRVWTPPPGEEHGEVDNTRQPPQEQAPAPEQPQEEEQGPHVKADEPANAPKRANDDPTSKEFDNSPNSYALFEAIASGLEEHALILARRGVGVNCVHHEHMTTPLHEAAWSPYFGPNLVHVLLQAGLNPSQQGKHVGSPLHWACESGKAAHALEKIRLLLDFGGDINAKDPRDDTCLHLAVYFQSPVEVLDLLVRRGASCGALDRERKTAYEWATQEDRYSSRVEVAARANALLNSGVALEAFCGALIPRLGVRSRASAFLRADGDGHLMWRVHRMLIPPMQWMLTGRPVAPAPALPVGVEPDQDPALAPAAAPLVALPAPAQHEVVEGARGPLFLERIVAPRYAARANNLNNEGEVEEEERSDEDENGGQPELEAEDENEQAGADVPREDAQEALPQANDDDDDDERGEDAQ